MILPHSPDSNSSTRRRSTRTRTLFRTHEWQKLLLHSDIANCLVCSKLRCLISIVSIVLLATDIPRSGLGVRRLDQYYEASILPDTVVRFGPYDYSLRHIWRIGDNEFKALQGADPVDSANVWSYKYDTTSLGLRGAVELLNVTEFPDFLLYKSELGQKNDHEAVLGLNTTFFMLDAFISAAKARMLAQVSWTPFRFATKHNWVDRAHQYLTHFIRQNRIWSLHSLHVPRIPSKSLQVCKTTTGLQPRFCTYPGIWECKHPLDPTLPTVRLSRQMDIRFQDLQRRYPDLVLDVALLSTHRPSMTSGTLKYTFFNCEEQEIVMLTRGRRCIGNNSTLHVADKCITIFVDDYRYERNILQTNVVDWYFFITIMRAGAQTYFWLRLILLYCTAFIGTSKFGEENQHWFSRVASAITIVFKIPFQVIVYSSLVPVVGYVVALLLDGNFMDIYLDSYWSTLEGASNFEFMSFLNSAVTQMRTVWLMALLVDLMVLVARKPINGSEEKIPGIRGLAISFTSALTIIGPYRQITFRNSEIVSAIRLPDVGQRMDMIQSTPQWFFNESTYLFEDSMTMLIFCVAAVAIMASVVRLVNFWMRTDRSLILISTLNVPYGTEFLWPTSSLSIRFNALTNSTPYQFDLDMRPSIVKISPKNPSKVIPPNVAEPTKTTTTQRFYLRPWRLCSRKSVSATTKKSPLTTEGGLRSRTPESHSILQLMNVAMMTDPWNFVWLRAIGIQLYLYRVWSTRVDNSSSLVSYAVILPYAEDELEERTGLSSNDFELLDTANSRDVAVSVLLQCG